MPLCRELHQFRSRDGEAFGQSERKTFGAGEKSICTDRKPLEFLKTAKMFLEILSIGATTLWKMLGKKAWRPVSIQRIVPVGMRADWCRGAALVISPRQSCRKGRTRPI